MIIYDNGTRVRIVLQLEGSVFLTTLPVGFASFVFTLGLVVLLRHLEAVGVNEWWAPVILRSWAPRAISTAISFTIVYRTSMALTRYWEAAQMVQVMFSKWSDSFATLTSFANTGEANFDAKIKKAIASAPDTVDILKKKRSELLTLRQSVAHDFSILSALATHRLTHGNIARIRRRSELAGLSDRIYTWSTFGRLIRHWDKLMVHWHEMRFQDLTRAWELPIFEVFELFRVQVHDGTTDFANPAAMQSDDLMHDPSGDSRDWKLLTRRRSSSASHASRDTDSQELIGPIMSGRSSIMSVLRSGDLSIREDVAANNETWTSTLAILGFLTLEEHLALDGRDTGIKKHVSQPDRVALVMAWVNEDINEFVDLCGIPPPIMSRAYQELASGMLGFNQAVKCADIPFPFPFAQLLEIFLWAFTIFVPFWMAVFTQGLFFSPCLAMFVTVAFWSLNEISLSLENPFSDGPNQLPLVDMHESFVESVRLAYSNRRPARMSV